MKLVWAVVAASALGAAGIEPSVPQTACQPGGFTLIRFSTGVEVRPKSDAAFSVSFDAANYQGNAFDAALRSAMSTWSAVSGSAWRYNFAGYTGAAPVSGDGQMTAVHGGRSMPSGVLATTLLTATGDGRLFDADIYFNSSADFTTAGGGIDFESVALHEMGHGLGLDHNDGCYPIPTVMQSAIARNTVRRTLDLPEIEGVRFLYPAAGSGGGGTVAVLAASPSALVFNAAAGGPAPPPQTVALSGTNGASWQAAVSANWIQASPGSGSLPATLNVAVAAAGLAPGIYSGRITVFSSGISREIAVSLTLAPPASMQVSSSFLSFTALSGGPPPAPQILTLTGTSGLAWTAEVTSGTWLRVSPPSGILPASVSVSAVTAGLAPQTYAGRIVIAAGGILREVTVQLVVTAQPQLQITPGALSLSAQAGNTLPACAALRVEASGVAADFTAAAGAPWLEATPAAGRLPVTLSVCANAGSLAAGEYTAALTLTASGMSPQSVPVRLTVNAVVLVREGGIRNAASYAAGLPVTGGEIVSIFGENLASQTAAATAFPLPVELAGCRVLIGGVPARLLYVSPRQINLVSPASLTSAAGSTTTLVVYNGPQASLPARLEVGRQAPGVFTVLGNGGGAGAVTHADGSLVTRSAPASAGETISVYLTGLGGLNPPVADGLPAPADPLSRATAPVRLLVDGQEAEVLYAGASPGFSGLQVVVATLPASLRRRFPEMVVEVAGTLSNRFTAGGATLLDITPAEIPAGREVTLLVRGVNLSASSALRIGAEALRGSLEEGPLQTLRVPVPARLIPTPGPLAVDVVDLDAPAEPASNPVSLLIRP